MDKAKGVIREHGLPRFLIATFLQLEDFIAETGDKKELLKNMKKQNSQSFNTVKQRFRKYLETEEYNIRAKMSEWREVFYIISFVLTRFRVARSMMVKILKKMMRKKPRVMDFGARKRKMKPQQSLLVKRNQPIWETETKSGPKKRWTWKSKKCWVREVPRYGYYF